MIISPTSILAFGMASGVVLYFGFKSRKNSKPEETKREIVDDGRCACCLAPFLVGRSVRCQDCGAKSCKKACSRWDTSDNAWHCIFCYQQRLWVRRNEKWFEIFGSAANEEDEVHSSFGTAKSRVYVAGHAVANMEQIQEDREEKYMVDVVRNFVEKMIEGLIDSVDDTPIDRLYKDSEYDTFLEEHHPPLIAALTRLIVCLEASLMNKPSTDPPVMAHAALKEIVERAVEEARKLPGLSADAEHPREGRAIADHSYEDLLATAILNKVIEKYQTERVDDNSNVLRDTDSSKAKFKTENGLEEENMASYTCYRSESNGDRSESITRNGDDQEPVSFMMEERIEEITTITDDDELRDNDVLGFKCARRVPFPEYGMDIVEPPRELSSSSLSSDSSDLNRDEFSPVRTRRHVADHAMDLVSPIESWEDNWLFQKKKTSRSQPDAVAMLVPSSNADYKALIGDRDAEDTSDLSECSSTKSDEEIEKELIEVISNVVPRTPRTSECDVESNQMLNRRKMLNETEYERDEIDVCQEEIKIEENVIICKRFDENKKNINESLLEEKAIKGEDDKETQNKSFSTLITVAEKDIGAIKPSNEEKPKDTIESDEKTIVNIAVESSAHIDVQMQSGKPNERSDRAENVADEEEEQQESEYTEHYDIAIQRHLDSLTKVEVYSGESETADETRKLTDEQLGKPGNNSTEKQKSERSETKIQSYAMIEKNYIDVMTDNDRLSAPPRPGTIAEREHKKWENAPPIENNPYSEENIRKRCLERQYSRTSDISGAHYELTKLNEVDLETLLVPNRPDIKRFGRDYYINQSKVANEERQERAKSAMSSSRPSSSLSQQSSCAGDEQREQQAEFTSKEADNISIPQEDKDTTASWRKNNAEVISPETNNRTVISRASAVDVGPEKPKSKDDEMKWKDHRTDDILENQRKNSKNEINAKLNNQEHNHEAEYKEDKDRKVRKIDLKAYGFENEFLDHKTTATRQQRVVNRLDLSSYGYHDGILRRAHSNYQLKPIMQNEKSNLTRYEIRRAYSIYDASKSFDCKDFAKSTKDLNKQDNVEQIDSRLISVKSMPNIADDMYYKANPVYVNQNQNDPTDKNLLNHVIDNSEEETTDERDAIVRDDSSLLNDYDEISSDVDRSFENIYIESKDQIREGVDEELQVMPSVKRLAQAFGRRQTSEIETAVPAKVTRASVAKTDDAKDRSSTPEIQIIETPRQMHSLTARSLSREFREGLRQMPNKVTSLPVSRSLIEELPTNQTEIVRSIREDNDMDVISPDKFKSNIIFWEQLQKRN